MLNFQGRFFQTLLLILALLFTAAVRYLAENDVCMTSTGKGEGANVTVSEVLAPYILQISCADLSGFTEKDAGKTVEIC